MSWIVVGIGVGTAVGTTAIQAGTKSGMFAEDIAIPFKTAEGLANDITGFLESVIGANPGLFQGFNGMALVNPQSPIGALAAADIAVQLGRSPIDIGKGPTVTIVNPLTGERQQIRLPGAINGKERKAFAAATAKISAAAREGRFAAIERIAQIQKDFPVATNEEIADRIGITRGVLDAATEKDFERSSQNLLEKANLGGFSPSAGLGLLGEELSQRSRQNDLDSIGISLALLEGEQRQAVTGLQALERSLNAPNAIATNLAGIETQGLASLGQQATAQANSIRTNLGANLRALFPLLAQQQQNEFNALAGTEIGNFEINEMRGEAATGTFQDLMSSIGGAFGGAGAAGGISGGGLAGGTGSAGLARGSSGFGVGSNPTAFTTNFDRTLLDALGTPKPGVGGGGSGFDF